jgi:hypothetical protein
VLLANGATAIGLALALFCWWHAPSLTTPRVVTGALICWSVLTMGASATASTGMLALLGFVTGLAEGIALPGTTILLLDWRACKFES